MSAAADQLTDPVTFYTAEANRIHLLMDMVGAPRGTASGKLSMSQRVEWFLKQVANDGSKR